MSCYFLLFLAAACLSQCTFGQALGQTSALTNISLNGIRFLYPLLPPGPDTDNSHVNYLDAINVSWSGNISSGPDSNIAKADLAILCWKTNTTTEGICKSNL